MRKQALPRLLDARKLCQNEARIEGTAAVAEMPRLTAGLASERGDAEINLHFFRDESGRNRLAGAATAQVELNCHRCHAAIASTLETSFDYVLLFSGDTEPPELPAQLDVIEVSSDQVEVLPLVEDELIIATPYASYHDDEGCAKATGLSYSPAQETGVEPDTHKPFAGLAEMLDGDKQEE